MLLHAMVLLGVTFIAGPGRGSAPGMEVLLVWRTSPSHATTLPPTWRSAQKGSGNTTTNVTETPSSIAAASAAGTDAVDAATARRPPVGAL
jgi:hypothetical protein